MADIQVANTDADLSGNTVVTEENAYTITGLHTFSRSTNAPFACISGAAYVQYLDSDKLDGQEGTYYLAAANFTGTLAVNQGGTGAATFTDGGILLGSGTGAITATAVLGDGVILIGDASGDPTTLDVGSSTAITILGTVATGVWNGTAVTVPYGGTGATSLTDGGVLLGSGTGAITATAVLGDGVILIGDASGDPTTLDVGSSTAITILGTVATGVWNGTAVTVAYGGTGASSLTDGGVLLGSGTGAVTAMAVLADSEMIVGDGSGDPVAESGATLRTSVGVGTGDSPQFTGLTLTGDLVVDTDTLFVDASEDKVAIGTTAMDGLLHIQSASAGSVSAHANADELVVEGSGNSGITILAGATSTANVFFGDAGNSSEGAIYFTNNATTASLNIQNEFGYINLLPSGGAATGVGVGLNDPDVMLDVSGGDNVLDIFRITQRASGAAAYGLQVGLAATGDPVFQRLVNDVATESFRIVRATGTPVFNEGSNDQDFRIESDDNANMFFVDGGEDRVGIGTATPDQIVDISSSSSIYPIVQTSAGNGNAVWRFKNDAETWEVGLRGDNSDKFTVGDITEGAPFFTLAIGTGNADFTGVVEGTGGFTSGTGSAVKLSQYNQTLDATDITNGYVTVTTTIARESVQNAVASMFDVSTNVFHSDLEDGYILDVYGATNWVRSSLGVTAAAGDIYKVLIWHY